jgi:hypothetical protein
MFSINFQLANNMTYDSLKLSESDEAIEQVSKSYYKIVPSDDPTIFEKKWDIFVDDIITEQLEYYNDNGNAEQHFKFIKSNNLNFIARKSIKYFNKLRLNTHVVNSKYTLKKSKNILTRLFWNNVINKQTTQEVKEPTEDILEFEENDYDNDNNNDDDDNEPLAVILEYSPDGKLQYSNDTSFDV